MDASIDQNEYYQLFLIISGLAFSTQQEKKPFTKYILDFNKTAYEML